MREKGKTKASIQKVLCSVKKSVKANFVFATLNFLFIVGFIQLFQLIFGAKNSVIAIILTILMGICASRDVSVAPLKHFLVQTLVLGGMAAAACFSVTLGPWLALPINLVTTFLLLYAYTYEYSGHLYFPYILSYLFLLYISPVPPQELPLRLLSVAAGSACMVLYALALCYRNIRKPARAALKELFDEASLCLTALMRGEAPPEDADKVRRVLHRLSKNAENRRRGLFELPASAFALLDAGRGMESLILTLHSPGLLDTPRTQLYERIESALRDFRLFTDKKTGALLDLDTESANAYEKELLQLLAFVREKLLKTAEKRRFTGGEKSALPLSVKLRAALGYSPVRLAYAIRVSLLLTAFILPVQLLNLAHGKWLLFTLASVSLPYAEDVAPKGRKRVFATLLGGAAATLCYALFPQTGVRTAIMMLSGYLSFYFKDYLGNYACATVGALGGAVAMGITGWAGVSAMFGIRIAYIAIGVAIAYAANLLIWPYSRRKASEAIYRKYAITSKLLAGYGITGLDAQAYYSLVIDNNLLEEKLIDNASRAGYNQIFDLTGHYREKIRRAHRKAFQHSA